jgi:hypothetical protein
MIPSLPLGVPTLFGFQFTTSGVKRRTVTGTGRDAVLRLRDSAIRTNGLLRLATPTVITAVQIVFSLRGHCGNHEEFLRA